MAGQVGLFSGSENKLDYSRGRPRARTRTHARTHASKAGKQALPRSNDGNINALPCLGTNLCGIPFALARTARHN